MLTCKIGDKKYTSIDKTEKEYRSLSKKGVLKCPITDLEVIYKKGKIKIPHFAYKEKPEGDLGFWENETKEHFMGKYYLYKWLKRFKYVKNLELEKWIPETKQIADIYFEILGKKYVIEYQCSNVNYERFEERRFLYSTLDIQDIWVFGIDNFNLYKHKNNFRKLKAIEYSIFNNEKTIYYFNPFKRKFYKVYGEKTKDVWNTKINSENFYIDRGEILLPKEIEFKFNLLLKAHLDKIRDIDFQRKKELFKKQQDEFNKTLALQEEEEEKEAAQKREIERKEAEEAINELKEHFLGKTIFLYEEYEVIKPISLQKGFSYISFRKSEMNYEGSIYILEKIVNSKQFSNEEIHILWNGQNLNSKYELKHIENIFEKADIYAITKRIRNGIYKIQQREVAKG